MFSGNKISFEEPLILIGDESAELMAIKFNYDTKPADKLSVTVTKKDGSSEVKVVVKNASCRF